MVAAELVQTGRTAAVAVWMAAISTDTPPVFAETTAVITAVAARKLAAAVDAIVTQLPEFG